MVKKGTQQTLKKTKKCVNTIRKKSDQQQLGQ